jgi:cytochrome c-type biogenesis protein CcmH/NrfG
MAHGSLAAPKRDASLAAAKWALIALPLSCAAAWSQSSGSATAKAAAQRCHAPHATVDVCDDAIRWNPKDSSLLVAMGDAQLRAKHAAEAARAYRHAAALAPNTPGIQQKIGDAEAALGKAKTKTAPAAATTAPAASKRFSNADPETQSH